MFGSSVCGFLESMFLISLSVEPLLAIDEKLIDDAFDFLESDEEWDECEEWDEDDVRDVFDAWDVFDVWDEYEDGCDDDVIVYAFLLRDDEEVALVFGCDDE